MTFDSDSVGRFIGIAIEIGIEIARIDGEVDSDSDRASDFDALSRGADKNTPALAWIAQSAGVGRVPDDGWVREARELERRRVALAAAS